MLDGSIPSNWLEVYNDELISNEYIGIIRYEKNLDSKPR